MRIDMHYPRWLAIVFCSISFLIEDPKLTIAYQADALADELSEEEAKQVLATERFLKVLEKSPRRGTALDRIYGHHVEFGSLDKFLERLNQRTVKNANDSDAWMLLGLFESQRGTDSTAVEAFRKATVLRPQDPMAPYYLGQSLLRIGQSAEAVAEFEQALTRKPARSDLLEIYQQLGRVHQRAQRTDEALKVWQRLETLFPDDPRVLEQIAVTLAEEGGHALALPRYQRLAELVKDDYRRVLFRVEAAGLKIKTNKRDEGISDMEAVLTDLNPDSWLYRDVRRRIENIFLKSGDQDNLVKYYHKWLESHTDDIEAMTRLAKFLASSARVPEAKEWMEKALKLAPSRSDLRKAFIDQLVDDQRIPDAIKQYELLVASAPSNPDFLRAWGKQVLKDKSQDIEARKKEATRIWNRVVAARPNDASNLAQVADLYRQANFVDEATELYQKAVELAPNDPQYREYLGEFLHIQKRTDEALKSWRSIAEGTRRIAPNVTRLAEVLSSFGFNDQAVIEIAEACRMDPKDFSLQIRSADYHMRANKFDDAMKFVAAAEKMAANDDEREGVVKQRIEILQSSQQLEAEIEQLTNALESNASATAEQWHLLARYQDADRQFARAAEAIDAAMLLDSKSIPILNTAAKIAEASGDFGRAAEMNRKLASVDRRSLGDHLMNVARLESQLGRNDEAIKAAQDLIVSAPGNTDHYEFMAQLCFRIGKPVEGLEALRKAVRINPNEPHLTTALGAALADQLRTDEAIEVYWRAFEKSDELDDKTSLTLKLVPLYQQINQFDKLIDRFERERREEEKRREMTICLAQAHNLAGDYGTARQELESLLSQDTRDTNLLQQLAKLCEGGSDLEAAIGYQRQLVAIAPGSETEFPLAKMLQTRGDRDEATEILVKLTRREEDPIRLLRSIDSLLSQSSLEAVLSITEPLLSQQRDDWELIYREGVAWALLNKSEEAKNRFSRLLAVTLPHDAMGVIAEDKFKKAQSKARSDNLRGTVTQLPTRQSPLKMLNMANQIQRAVGLTADYNSGSSGPQPVWMPEAFGVSRMAAYGWLLRFEEDAKSETIDKTTSPDEAPSSTLMDQVAKRAKEESANRESIYDYLYAASLKTLNDEVFGIARRLAKIGGNEEQEFFLSSLRLRGIAVDQNRSSARQTTPKKTPLSESDLDLMTSCYDSMSKTKANEMMAGNSGGQIIYSSNGQAFINVGGSFMPISGVSSVGMLGAVVSELRLAGREDQSEELFARNEKGAKSAAELSGLMSLRFEQEKFDKIGGLYARWSSMAKQEIAKAATVVPTRQNRGNSPASRQLLGQASSLLARWMGKLGPDEEHSQILAILDQALDVAIEDAKQRRASRSRLNQRGPTSAARSASGNPVNFQLMYGKESIRATIDFPRPNDYVDQTTLMMLRQVFEIFKRNDVLADLPAHLRKRASQATDDDRLYEQLILASALWWNDEQDEAVEMITKAADALKEDVNFRFEMASLREMRGDFDEALAIIESIVPKDQQLLQRKELVALQIAERLGDNDRAFAASERLFGLRLDTDTQLNLAQRMRRLGMHEMADAIVARVERKAGSQTASLVSLMTMYRGQGKTTEAKQIAHMLLQRTASPNSSMSNATRNPFRSSQSSDSTRTQALQVLQQTGELKVLIGQTETQLARSPDSIRLYELLIEFYTAQGDRAKAGEFLDKAVKQKPDSIALRYQLAKQLEQTNKPKEACDQYLELIKLKPEWVTEDLYSVQRIFQQANRTLELVDAIRGINVKKITQPYYITNLVSTLMQDEKNTEVAVDLFEKVFDAFPSYRSNMMSDLSNPKLWSNDRIFRIGKRGLIPSAGQVSTNPWFGVDEIRSYGQDGEATGMFGQMLQGIGANEKRTQLQSSIAESIQASPNWLGGKAMLALLDIAENRKEQGWKNLADLFGSDETIKDMPSNACWIIGQELDKSQQGRPTAIKLFEHAVLKPDSNSMQQIQYSPCARLAKLYSDSGRKDDARALILKQLRGQSFPNYDAQYGSYMKIQNSKWAASKLMELGFPVDAAKLYRELMSDTKSIEMAANFGGNGVDGELAAASAGMSKALASLDSSNANEAISQLLSIPGTIQPGAAAIDLMLSLPDSKTIQKKKMESGLVDLFVSLSKSATTAKAIEGRLQELQEKVPHDISVGIAIALFRQKIKSENANESIKRLAELVSNQSLDEIPDGRRPNSRQRREAALFVPLWMVARECLANKDQQPMGLKLAERAAIAARRQEGTQHAMVVLFDWAKLEIEQSDRSHAESKLTELLKIATERPKRKKETGPPMAGLTSSQITPSANLPPGIEIPAGANLPPALAQRIAAGQPPQPNAASQVTKTSSESTPPLTLSQFQLAMTIASMAADSNMPQLSRKAVQDSLVGGIPVADIAPVKDANAGGMSVRVVNNSRNSRTEGGSAIEPQVARSMKGVVSKWKGEEYPAKEVYGLLKPLVLPPSRATEILLYADSTGLREAKLSSLADSLVTWAKRAGTLEELNAEIDERKKNPNSAIPASVLQILIAMALDPADQSGKAKSLLDELAQQCSKGTSPILLQVACHAALPATTNKALHGPAFAILKTVVEQNAKPASNDLDDPFGSGSQEQQSVGKLAEKVNRFMADNGDSASVKSYFDSLLAVRQTTYSRYGGDYGTYLQNKDYGMFASEAARIGMLDVVMDFMGRTADAPTTQYSSSGQSLPLPMAVSVRHFHSTSAAERYDAWHAWTMPTEGRQTVRVIAERIPYSFAPVAFLKNSLSTDNSIDAELTSNLTELIDAARNLGSLETLKIECQKAVEQKLPNAETLLSLILIELGDVAEGKPLIEKLVKVLLEKKKDRRRSNAVVESDFLLFHACMKSSAFATIYKDASGKQYARASDFGFLNAPSYVAMDLAKRAIADADASVVPGTSPELIHWIESTSASGQIERKKPWWAVQEGRLFKVLSGDSGLLCLRYPLQGDFEFAMDIKQGFNGDIGFGGVVFSTLQNTLMSLSGDEQLYNSFPNYRPAGSNGMRGKRLQFKSTESKHSVLIDGNEIFAESSTETSPWLSLFASGQATASFSNLEITGSPIIPREVRLIQGDSMDGWNCSFFGNSRYKKRLMSVKTTDQNDPNHRFQQQQQQSSDFDWAVIDGVLTGEGKPDLAEKMQSWVYYYRPLQRDETFRYEFFHKPGESVAHPTIGRVAVLLEPSGAKAHWISRAIWDDLLNEIPFDNVVDEPSCRRGPETPPLKVDDWNAVELTIKNDTAVISLNSVVIYERPMEPQLDSRFGLFRYKNETTKVRNVTLSGPWPTELTSEMRKELLATVSLRPAKDRQVIHSIVTDQLFETDVPELMSMASELPPDDAYRVLKKWVLPSDDHNNFRLYYQLATDDGRLQCPAVELIRIAAVLNRLPDLASEISATNPANDIDLRNRNAIQTLVAMQQGDEKIIRSKIGEVYTAIDQGLSKDLAERDRSAEFVVAWQASLKPSLLSFASDIVVSLLRTERKGDTSSKSESWRTRLGILSGRITKLRTSARKEQSTVADKLTQWQSIADLKPEHDPAADGSADWLYQRGMLEHIANGSTPMLFFQSPIRGKFEIVGQRSMHGSRDMAVAYGMHSVDLVHDKPAISITKLPSASRTNEQRLDVPEAGDLADVRIVVDGSKVTTHINGAVVHQELFSEPPSPWVVLKAQRPHFESLVRNLRIVGAPEIPSEINLIELAGLGGWRADLFADSHSGDRGFIDKVSSEGENYDEYGSRRTANEAWQHIGDELVGARKERMSTVNESSLMYQRPLLENGEIEWESFFIPGEVEVHPSIGPLAFLIQSSGVTLHKMTRFGTENLQLAPNNESAIEGTSGFALKEKDWNRFKLSMNGDRMTLFVNDQQVVQYSISEKPTARFFGLFHYSNKTQSRIRNLVYRGDWPKTLPSVADQQLAYPKGGPLPWTGEGTIKTWELTSLDSAQKSGFAIQGRRDQLTTSDAGLAIVLTSGALYENRPALQLPMELGNDCEVTLNFNDLKMFAPKEGWGTLLSLVANLDDTENSSVECTIKSIGEGKVFLCGSIRRDSPTGQPHSVETLQVSSSIPIGGMRLVKKKGEIHCLFSESGTDEFQLVQSLKVGSSPIKSILIEAKSSDDAGQVDVKLQKLTIRKL